MVVDVIQLEESTKTALIFKQILQMVTSLSVGTAFAAITLKKLFEGRQQDESIAVSKSFRAIVLHVWGRSVAFPARLHSLPPLLDDVIRGSNKHR